MRVLEVECERCFPREICFLQGSSLHQVLWCRISRKQRDFYLVPVLRQISHIGNQNGSHNRKLLESCPRTVSWQAEKMLRDKPIQKCRSGSVQQRERARGFIYWPCEGLH